jgi:thiosulfate dehydrogenase [quinone] large subunit
MQWAQWHYKAIAPQRPHPGREQKMNLESVRGVVPTGTGGSDGSSRGLETSEGNLQIANWLFRSKAASIIWLAARLWLGYEWLNAGYQKIWGSESSAFWSGSGTAVKGFATAGIAGSATGKGGASYGWWAGFLHNFVVPNSSWIAKLIAVSEVAIGVLLIVGLFTGVAAVAGIALNVIYMFSGTAGVNPAYAIVALLLIMAWRNAGYLGLDRFALPMVHDRLHRSGRTRAATAGGPTSPLPVH